MFFRAGKPPVGLHLDVLKNDKLIQVYQFYIVLNNQRIIFFRYILKTYLVSEING